MHKAAGGISRITFYLVEKKMTMGHKHEESDMERGCFSIRGISKWGSNAAKFYLMPFF